MSYPDAIKKAIRLIALDNGAINRNQTAESVVERAWNEVDQKFPTPVLRRIDAELEDLSEEDFDTLCCGEHGAIKVSTDTEEALETAFNAI